MIWLFVAVLAATVNGMAQQPEALRKERDSLVGRGMWRDAVTFYQEKLMPLSDEASGSDLERATEALGRLNAWGEFDALVEAAVLAHGDNAALLTSAATVYQRAPHHGEIVAGEFTRARGYGGRRMPGRDATAEAGQAVDTGYRDHVRALQLLKQAVGTPSSPAVGVLAWRQMAATLMQGEAWKLQTLTPLETLPEWGEPGPEGGTEGAQWAGEGPLLYQNPESWEKAANDGARWRFALTEQERLSTDKDMAAVMVSERARFALSQFGVETLSSYAWWRQQDTDSAKGILQLDTLAEDECLAKTSDGVRRFKLGAEFHPIALYRSILENPLVGGGAGDALVRIFLNRGQRDKALEVLDRTIQLHGPGNQDQRGTLRRQITGSWGRFEPAETVAAGTKPILPLVFRNGRKISLTAAPVDMDAVLADTISYLKGNPKQLDWQRVNPSAISSELIRKQGSKYIGGVAAQWEEILTPEDGHRDARVDLTVPIDKPGGWWITGRMEDGNSFHTLVWIVDSVLAQNDVGGMKQWWVSDAVDGAPVVGSQITFFGYRTVYRERSLPLGRNMDVRTKQFERSTDDDGKTMLKPGDFDDEYQWIAIARKQGRATSFFGFQPYYIQQPQLENGNRDLGYGISDRPLYKPGDTAHLRFYLRNVGYDQPDESKWAKRKGTLTLTNGRGEEVMKIEQLRTDALGAVGSEVVIPKDGGLGVWRATYQIGGGISVMVMLRVEEYRKPEYEVKVEAPSEPVRLGDRFTATVKASYFHGSPVRNAKVEIIVRRSSLDARWFPNNRWDWLYGRGAWWNGSEAGWHPTWQRWGCMPPNPPWWQGERWTPDELVMKRNLAMGPDGTAKVVIDTAAAKASHGDMDSSYSIEARVVDASRREERGNGEVIAARRPFEVVVWTDRGFTRTGEAVEATISAATMDGKPVVAAKGTLKLYEITGDGDGRIVEKEVRSFDIVTDGEGRALWKFAAPETGQYRLAASLSTDGGEAVEGAAILNVFGPGRDSVADWHFGPLELLADKATHAPGETLKLRVNSDRENANVWLFLHVAGSAGREAKRIRLDGRSLEVEVPLDARDMPNMFIEGVTVHGAKLHTAVRQILLPPVSKMIDVTLAPAKDRLKPGETSTLGITLRDDAGNSVTGTVVLAVYDKALEAITGGSNVGLIHENFWTWKNTYYPGRDEAMIPGSPGNLHRPKEKEMQMLGRFAGVGVATRSAMGGAARNKADLFVGRSEIAPAAMAAPAEEMKADADEQAAAPTVNPIVVRKDFADLLKWNGAIETDADGHAVIPLEFPDNLTTWKARVWFLGEGTRVGEGTAEIITSKELLVRLQAPRFLVERDEAVLSAVVQNDHDVAKSVEVSLELDGGVLEPIAGADGGAVRTVEIAARSEARVDWRVRALREGEATLRMKADAGSDGDAVERKLPVRVAGMLRQDAWSRAAGPDEDSTTISLEVPEERRSDQTKLTVRFSPTIAGAVVDAIPYLADYPHGCTEQTLNRFVPAVIAQRMLRDLDIDLAEVKAKRNNLNPQELGDAATRAEQWKQWQRNPVFDEVELEKMISKGIGKLMSMQVADGGWGWFSGYGERSWPHTTAVVVHGLLVAKENGAKVPDAMLDAGVRWLMAYERKQAEALQLHVERQALRVAGKKVKDDNRYEKRTADALDAFIRVVLGEAGRDSEPMLAFLYRDRVSLPVYAQCLLGLEEHRKNDVARRDEVMRMISQFVRRDPENQTSWLELGNKGYWWNWYGSEVEAHAWYLKLLAAVRPDDADTRGLVKYLVNNRKHSTYWESTRDTAFAVEAIAAYFKASGEDASEMDVRVILDDKEIRAIKITKENLFAFDGTVVLSGEAVTSGGHRLVLDKAGSKGTLYANVYLEVFTLEDKLRAAGLEVKVARHVSRLIPLEKESEVPDSSGLVVKQQVERFRREPLKDGDTVKSGDRIEVELVLESKNDYEYLIFSDAKAAGFEALDTLSGYVSGSGGLGAYMEPRDETVDFFIRSLPRGTSTLRYQLRAETPGAYKALPATAEAMYAPELRGNSEDIKLRISE